jgi:predicted DNA-binding protein
MQIQITADQDSALEAAAEATGRPKAALVREAIELWRRGEARRERLERALDAVGGFRSGLQDISERHDDYLGEALEEEFGRR